MKKKVFIATVQIAFEIEDQTTESGNVAYACDVVSAIFTENLRQENVIIDWQYNPENGVYPDPVYIGEFDVASLDEGEIFQPLA